MILGHHLPILSWEDGQKPEAHGAYWWEFCFTCTGVLDTHDGLTLVYTWLQLRFLNQELPSKVFLKSHPKNPKGARSFL